jgi:hypothetical protein
MKNKSTVKQTTIKSSNGRLNLLNREVPQIHVLHPVMSHYLSLRDQGLDVESWIKDVDIRKVDIEDYPDVKTEELYYYYKLFRYLEKNGYFGKAKQEKSSKQRSEHRNEGCRFSSADRVECRDYNHGNFAGIMLLLQ